jgi:hypothetical protein
MVYRQRMNQYNENKEEERAKYLGYIIPIITYYAENNRIDPAICYEVCHELELMMIEKCKAKGMNTHELEKHESCKFCKPSSLFLSFRIQDYSIRHLASKLPLLAYAYEMNTRRAMQL